MKPYDNYVEEMLSLLKARNVCAWSRESHRACYKEYEEFLQENGLEFSFESANQWLEEVIKPKRTRQEYAARWRYMAQMVELIETGTVINDHLLLTKSYYNKLPDELKSEVNLYLDSCKEKYSKRSFALARIYCSQFILYIHERGISSIEELKYCDICDFYATDHHCTPDTRYVLLIHARQLLRFLGDANRCSIGFSMLLSEAIYPYVTAFKDLSPAHQETVKLLSKSAVCTVSEMLGAMGIFIGIYKENGYAQTAIKTAEHTLRALYLFLDINGLNYHPEISYIWFRGIIPIIGQCYRSWRRVLRLFEEYITGNELFLDKKYSFKTNRMEKYPEWCRSAIVGYLDWLRRSFHSSATIRHNQYSVWSFCDYLLKQDANDFEFLTPELLKKYLAGDKHTTFRGRATRITVIRQFIGYLEDYAMVSNKNLHLALSSGTADSVKIAEVLSDENVASIHKYREESSYPLELRNAAMVMIGLRLGFRSSDVINLKFSDIDWAEKTVSIIQEKTHAAITLPLSNDVGNAIYRYIKYGRPKSSSKYIFIRHKAPYGKVTSKICCNALCTIIPERKDLTRAGFHVLRRTFATGILRRNAGIERVIDSLGHQDNTSVMKYLSFDAERMSKCSLSLKDCNLQLKGGLL